MFGLKLKVVSDSMYYYKLNEDVYIVNGANKHCIYDLKKGNLYNINQKALNLIEQIITKKASCLEKNEKTMLSLLRDKELIIEAPHTAQANNISSLRIPPTPKFAWIEVTRQCNLSCIFCYEGSNPYCTEKINMNDFVLIYKELVDIGIKNIQFIGGEPLILKNDLKKMIKYCRDYFDFIEVYTNGTLINEDWAAFFKEYNILLAMSIHSYIPEEHDRLTKVRGAHKKALRGLSYLKKYKIKYRIATIRNASCNIGEKPNNVDYSLYPTEPKVVGSANLAHYNFDMFKKKAITKSTFYYPLNKNMIINALSGHQCFIKDLYIDSQLNVFPCVMERRILYGNIKNKKLKDIVDNNTRMLSKDNIEECSDCEFRYACFDCRPDSIGTNIYQKPWYCTYNPYKGEWCNVEEVFKNIVGHQSCCLTNNSSLS